MHDEIDYMYFIVALFAFSKIEQYFFKSVKLYGAIRA